MPGNKKYKPFGPHNEFTATHSSHSQPTEQTAPGQFVATLPHTVQKKKIIIKHSVVTDLYHFAKGRKL